MATRFDRIAGDTEKTRNDPPQVGDRIYVPSAWYIDHGEDDFAGGWAIVSKVKQESYGLFITIEERPDTGYNWDFLRDQQDKLQKEYGEQHAHPDPDYG
jgi:hypothetical protein